MRVIATPCTDCDGDGIIDDFGEGICIGCLGTGCAAQPDTDEYDDDIL